MNAIEIHARGRQRISVGDCRPFPPPFFRTALKTGRRCLKAGWQIVCLTLALPLSASAATYSVAPDGNDTADGSPGAPWRTLLHAVKQVQAGDTVLVQPGYYPERIDWKYASGTPEQRITFLAQGAVTNYGWNLRGQISHVTLQGFTVTGQDTVGNNGAFRLNDGNTGIAIISNVITHAEEMVASGAGLPYGIRASNVTNTLIRANRFLNLHNHALVIGAGRGYLVESNYFTSPHGYDAISLTGSDTVIRRNIFYDLSNYGNATNNLHCDLIQAFAVNDGQWTTNVVVEENFAKDCTGTQIIMVSDNAAYPRHVRDWTIRNNVWVNVSLSGTIYCEDFKFYNNTYYRSGNSVAPIMFRDGTPTKNIGHNGQVFNNIFYECCEKAGSPIVGFYLIGDTVTNVVTDHNLVIGVGAGTVKDPAKFTDPHGLRGVDPLFVDVTADGPEGWRLRTGSPAIGAGTNLNHLFTTDFGGNLRRDSWDIGAWQGAALPSGAEFSRPTPPSGMRMVLSP